LVGDACQAVSLLAAQGASLAIAGAYVLGEHLAKAQSIEAAVAGYQRVWQPVIEEKQRVGRRGAEWFLPTNNIQLTMRRIMLNLSALPSVDRIVGNALVGKSAARIQDVIGQDSALDRVTASTAPVPA
jgi:2-polyprenyl-6-methoxyphenol hydroxylase-like FAD-dependent oxidoreductase